MKIQIEEILKVTFSAPSVRGLSAKMEAPECPDLEHSSSELIVLGSSLDKYMDAFDHLERAVFFSLFCFTVSDHA